MHVARNRTPLKIWAYDTNIIAYDRYAHSPIFLSPVRGTFCPVTFCPVTFCPVAFCPWDVLSCGILSVGHYVLWHFVRGTFCPVTFCPVTFCPVAFCPWDVLSCGILSVGQNPFGKYAPKGEGVKQMRTLHKVTSILCTY